MKIAIDRGPLETEHKFRGVGAYTRELIIALKKLNYNIHDINFETSDLSDYDIIHYPYFDLFSVTLPFGKPTKIIVTIHDLIPLIYPKYYPPGIKGKSRFLIQKNRLRKVDAILTMSETSKKDIVRFLGIPSDEIHVVPLAASSSFKEISDKTKLKRVRDHYKLPSKFVFYVGDVNYNKNVPSLLEACRIIKVPLVICGKHATEIEEKAFGLKTLKGPRDWMRFMVGKPHPEFAHIRNLLKGFGSSQVLRLGYVPEEDLVGIYNLATVYCQPAFYEGFGIPVLEAFATGCPVVVARTNALVELANGAALIADSKDPKDMASKLVMLFQDLGLRAKLIREGKNRVEDFSWQKTAQKTAEVYKKVVSSR